MVAFAPKLIKCTAYGVAIMNGRRDGFYFAGKRFFYIYLCSLYLKKILQTAHYSLLRSQLLNFFDLVRDRRAPDSASGRKSPGSVPSLGCVDEQLARIAQPHGSLARITIFVSIAHFGGFLCVFMARSLSPGPGSQELVMLMRGKQSLQEWKTHLHCRLRLGGRFAPPR